MKFSSFLLVLPLAALFQIRCGSSSDNRPDASKEGPAPPSSAALTSQPTPVGFNDYWYQGKAELSTYDVQQERYGEMRTAEQVNVFVTEDFSKKKQVKLDDAASAGTDRVPILKWNAVRRFHTGIYDYSIMTSVFSPVDGSNALKTTCTVQDWCGQVFFQTNLEKSGIRAQNFSYFETEGDLDKKLPLVWLEDELWTKIRLDPAAIPTGTYSIIPASTYLRLRHKPLQPEAAEVQLATTNNESTLTIRYVNIQRTLLIRFEAASPYRILGWEETGNGQLQSKGTLKSSLMSAYWSQHDNASSGLRDSLRLKF